MFDPLESFQILVLLIKSKFTNWNLDKDVFSDTKHFYADDLFQYFVADSIS